MKPSCIDSWFVKAFKQKQCLPMTYAPKKFWVFLIILKGTAAGFSWFWVNTCDWLDYLIQIIHSFLEAKLGNDSRSSQTCWVSCRLLVGAPSLARDSIGTVAEFDMRHFEMPASLKVTVESACVWGRGWQWRMCVHQLFCLPFLIKSLRSISVNHTLHHDFMWKCLL